MKTKFTILLFLFVTGFSYAQFGASLGYANGKGKVTAGGATLDSESEGAFTLGVIYDARLSDNLDLQPGIIIGLGKKVEGQVDYPLGVGAALQYYIAGRSSRFWVGPTLGLNVSFDDVDTDVIKKSVTNGGVGIGLDLSDSITLAAGYATSLVDMSNVDAVTIKENAIWAELQVKF
jgi:hypothetical protein